MKEGATSTNLTRILFSLLECLIVSRHSRVDTAQNEQLGMVLGMHPNFLT